MTIRVLASILSLIWTCATYGANEVRQLPAQKTGTGNFDRYNLGAEWGDDPAVYFIAISLKGKLDAATAMVQCEGAVLEIIRWGIEKAYLSKFQWVVARIDPEALERGQRDGLQFSVTSKAGQVTFSVPKEQFRALMREAVVYDLHSRRIAEVTMQRAEEAARENERIEKAKQREAAIQALPGLSHELRQAVRDRKILVGMPPEAVELAWGKPNKKRTIATPRSETVIWEYGRSDLYFVGGKLRDWVIIRGD